MTFRRSTLEELKVPILNDLGKEMEKKGKELHALSKRTFAVYTELVNVTSRKDARGMLGGYLKTFAVATLFWIETQQDQAGNDIRTITMDTTELHMRKLK